MRTKRTKIAMRVVLVYWIVNEHPYSLLYRSAFIPLLMNALQIGD